MASERFEFPGGGGQRLVGRFDRPEGPARATALFVHCFSCGKDVLAASRVSRRLAAHGLATLRFDFTGLGESDGEFANGGFASDVADVIAAADALRARGEPATLLIGHSLGGAAALAAARATGVTAVATINAPSDVSHVLQQFGDRLDLIERDGRAEVRLAGRPFTLSRSFVDQARAAMVLDAAAGLGAALLVLHAPADDTVAVDHAGRIYAAARHPKSFVALARANHLLTGPGDADYAADVVAAWAGRYL